MKKLIACIVSISLVIIFLVFPQETANGAKNGLNVCLNVLIPSLFPFMVISLFLIISRLHETLFGKLGKGLAQLLRLPQPCGGVIILSMFGGYPSGAKNIDALYSSNQITQKQAERMILFCVNAGPAFLCTAVGCGFLHNPAYGRILLISNILSAFILAFIESRFHRKENFNISQKTIKKCDYAKAFVMSTKSASQALLSMCIMVILFFGFLEPLKLLIPEPYSSFISSVLEITLGCKNFSEIGLPLWAFAMLTSWGGVCVHLQILQGNDYKINILKFALFRIFHALISGAVTYGFMLLYPDNQTQAVFGNNIECIPKTSSSVLGSTMLIIMCIFLCLNFLTVKSNKT